MQCKQLYSLGNRIFFLVAIFLFGSLHAFAQPTFNTGEDPKPNGKKWELIPILSDEFDGNALNANKWQNTDPRHWVGRTPGIFKANAVSQQNGELKLTNYQLASPETVRGNRYTHAGGYIRSKNKAQVGTYIECRMKANKTFMSSTFWLINLPPEESGCDRRTVELDIQECVGQITGNASWSQNFDKTMHSNTHSRNVSCNTPTGSKGGNTSTGGFVYDDYHTYAAWWKSPKEILFYLDGVYKYSATPVADFDLGMYLMMVTETYDWNPVPNDGGMNGSVEDRTTSYQWVRTWQLVDDNGSSNDEGNNDGGNNDQNNDGTDAVNCNSLPSVVPSSTSIPVTVDYSASQNRDIVVELWNQTTWLGQGKVTVGRGSGTAELRINLNTVPPAGTNYLFKSSVRPVDTNWQQNIDACNKNGISLTGEDNNSGANDGDTGTDTGNNNNDSNCTNTYANGRHYFDKGCDFLLANFDMRPDEDDIHTVAALASMLLHPDLQGVDYHAIAGAYGTQGGSYITTAAPSFFNNAFGTKNVNWSDAHGERTAAVSRVKNRVINTLSNGHQVFVQEAGQSDFTHDVLKAVIDENNGVSANDVKSNVIVVQHSQWNEDQTTQWKLNWVRNNTDYRKIADGNVSGNGTPQYKNNNRTWMDRAKAADNPNAGARAIWTQADAICDNFQASWENPTISGGGIDYSDASELWWIFNIGNNADNISKFWERYVVNTNSNTDNNDENNGTTDCANYSLNALSDFPNISVSGFRPAYKDNAQNALAINAAQYKGEYAAAVTTFSGATGIYNLSLNTLAELDGESTYRIAINGNRLAQTFTNPVIFGTSKPDYAPARFTWRDIPLQQGDNIRIEFNSATNGKIPEGNSTAFSRGRWTTLDIVCLASDSGNGGDNGGDNNGNTGCEGYTNANGRVVIEAEQLNLGNTAWQEQANFNGYTGNSYIIWKGNDQFGNPGTGVISTKINITEPGTYAFQWRSKVGLGNNSTEHNDSWLRFPDAADFYGKKGNSIVYPKGSGKTPAPEGAGGGGWFKVYLSNSTDWTWISKTSDNDAHDIFVKFDNAGEYTMQISGRSKEHAIDRIVLYKQGNNNPTSLTHAETPCTDNGGNDNNEDAGNSCNVGSPCDDGNACTTNDIYDANCDCVGAFQDSDGDGICNSNDECPNDASNTCNNPPPPPPSNENEQFLTTIHDAYLQNGTRYDNTLLRIESNRRVSYLMFDLDQVQGKIETAELQLWVENDAGNGGIEIALGDSNNWLETNISNSNKPNVSRVLANVNRTYGSGTLQRFTLNNLPSSGTVSLIVTHKSGNDVSFHSSEHGTVNRRPQLKLTLKEEGMCTIGNSCDDGNACTINDQYDADCNCAGTFQDSDNDGICDSEDTCNDAGKPCDDGNACTINDQYDANCNCVGTVQDSDNDGICDREDTCPNDASNTCQDNPADTETEHILTTIHDAYLQNGTRFNNEILRVEQNQRVSYLMFDLDEVQGEVESAELLLWVENDPGNGLMEIALGNHSDWLETNISNANKPHTIKKLADSYRDYDRGTLQRFMLEDLPSTGKISLLIKQLSGNDFSFHSSEHSDVEKRPQLRLVMKTSSNNGENDVDNNNGEDPSNNEDQVVDDCTSLDIKGGAGSIELVNIPTDAKLELFGPSTNWENRLLCEGNCDSRIEVTDLMRGPHKIIVQSFNPYCYNQIEVRVDQDYAGNRNNNLVIQDNEIYVYPNPVKEELSLSLPNFEDRKATVQIINLFGQVELEKTLETIPTQLKLDVRSLQNGVYYLAVKLDNSRIIAKKVMISRLY